MRWILCTLLTTTIALPAAARQQDPAREAEAAEPWWASSQTAEGTWAGDEGAGELTATALMTLILAVEYPTTTKPDATAAEGPALRRVIRAGVAHVLAHLDPLTGVIAERVGAPLVTERDVVEHATCLLLLAELRPLWTVVDVRAEAIDAAVGALLRAQREDGTFGTARATGWSVYALVAAREAGWKVDPAALLRGRDALNAAVRVAGEAGPLEVAALDPTGVALACLLNFMVQPPEDAESDEARAAYRDAQQARLDALSRLTAKAEAWSAFDPEQRLLVALAGYNAGGETWQRTTLGLKASVLPLTKQRMPRGSGPFPRERDTGEARATAFGVLALGIYFRYSSILGAR